jgi:hypothetical protein
VVSISDTAETAAALTDKIISNKKAPGIPGAFQHFIDSSDLADL